MSKTIVFIYNAESGAINAIGDTIHKFMSPETYPCILCDLTHGYFSQKKQRTKFLNTLNIPIETYHNDELENLPFTVTSLPAVLITNGSDNILWELSGNDRKTINSLEQLIKIIKKNIKYGL